MGRKVKGRVLADPGRRPLRVPGRVAIGGTACLHERSARMARPRRRHRLPGRGPSARAAATTGEAVFTTTMTGYQEVLTDPRTYGQLVTMTAPQIGNVGVNAADTEAVDGKPRVAGFVVRDASPPPSSWRAEAVARPLPRARTASSASPGSTRASSRGTCATRARRTAPSARRRPRSSSAPRGGRRRHERARPRAATSRRARPYPSTDGARRVGDRADARAPQHHVVAVDFGTKRNILRCLVDAGCQVTVVPATHDGGRGPRAPPRRHLPLERPRRPGRRDLRRRASSAGCSGKKPVFGICLGHQLLGLALGGEDVQAQVRPPGREPAREGPRHRPKVEITTQNHGFCVDLRVLAGSASARRTCT